MTDANYTDITLVLDASGSMSLIRSDAEGAVNSFLDDQKKEPGRATVSIFEFRNKVTELATGIDLATVKPYRLVPSGNTALRDAWGEAVTKTGARLAAMPEDERPGTVVVVIVTDGEENASKEWTADAVKELTEQQERDYGWTFVFLAANQDAVTAGAEYGIDAGRALTYTASGAGAAKSYAAASSLVSRTRSGISGGFTDAERDAANSN